MFIFELIELQIYKGYHIFMNTTQPHNLPEPFTLTDSIKTEIGTVYFYGNFVVVEMNEGVNVSFKTGFSILLKGLSILGGKPCIYIANRIHSYSVTPTDYKYLNKVPSLKGVAIVNHLESTAANTQLEASFCKKPFEVFNSLEEAFQWGEKTLKSSMR
tara:strand:- start:12138 stop:12611 length:474 start_codon:yes stop_codon:yes gene_type:complete